MRTFRFLSALIILLLVVPLTACAKTAAPTKVAGASVTKAPVAEKDFEDFDYNNFKNSTTINHKWYPFVPGTQYVYIGTVKENGEVSSHKVAVNVTDLTKVIDGITTRVNYIEDITEGQVVEAELAFFAQDDSGNVWRMGEHPEVYENGVFVEAPTWVSGIAGAHAGIAMRAEPKLGTPSYSQGWGPGVMFTDRGQVSDTGLQVCTPLDCFEDVIVIRESSREEVGVYQFKYYAPGKYNIRVDWKGEEQKQEILELTEINQLTPEVLAEVRTKALAVEKHAYEISKDVYGLTPPMAQPVTAQ